MEIQQHVLVLPFPAQGHVNPLMHFSQKLAQHGFKVTFVNTDFNNKRVVSAMNKQVSLVGSTVKLISVPDGLGPQDDRNNLANLALAILRTMPSALEKVIKDINNAIDDESERITCIIADLNMTWVLKIAQKLGIKGALLNPSSAAVFAMQANMHKLIQDGIMDSDGFQITKAKFQLSPEMPLMDPSNFPWSSIGDKTSQKIIHDYIAKMMQYSHLTDWWLSNTITELEHGAISFHPKILPIGPLMESKNFRSLGQFWEEDLSCLRWLDQQPPCSVIYIAFGSFTLFDPNQFRELALGLELTKRPFVWVVREDINNNTRNEYPDEFQGNFGKVVKWAPQQVVLSHPATACFMSHCGWNSTMEGVSNGVPFLCWPYYADQFYNKSYICDVWKVGLGFDLDDEKGIVSRWEIKKKVEQLFGDDSIRERCNNVKEMFRKNMAIGGQSHENFNKFTEWLKE